MIEAIEPALARKLDALTVPPLAADFSSRVLARAVELPLGGAAPDAPPLPKQRRAMPRRLWRAGATGLGAIALGMMSISAAAMGYFGEPIRKAVASAPVIGNVVERVIPQPVRKAARPQLAARPAAKLAADPSPVAETLPGEASTAAEVLPAGRGWRARAAAMTPEQRAAWLAAHPVAAERIARRKAWRESHPEQAARIDAHQARRRAIAAERRERRRAARAAWQQPSLAPEAQMQGDDRAPAMQQRPWRLERRERIRQWRERRGQLRELPGAGSADPAGPIQP